MRSAISYQFVPLFAAKLVERKGVDAREKILLKKALGMGMNAKPNAVQNIYGTICTKAWETWWQKRAPS